MYTFKYVCRAGCIPDIRCRCIRLYLDIDYLTKKMAL